MAKIQVYVNDNVSEKINAIAVQRRAEGAKRKISAIQALHQCCLN
jgi:hypothetical protein